MLEWLLRFFRRESCGKCTPCREGVRLAHEIVQRIAAGDGQAGDVPELRRLASLLDNTSFCGLGKSIELPIKSALEHFAKDFQADAEQPDEKYSAIREDPRDDQRSQRRFSHPACRYSTPPVS